MSADKVFRWSRMPFSRALLVALATGPGAPTQAQTERTLPPRLEELIGEVATMLSNTATVSNRLDNLESKWRPIWVHAYCDAAFPADEALIQSLVPERFRAETARTDKQLSASGASSTSTSLIEKPSWSSLLSLAIEHGAVERAVNGTSVTLGSSFFALAQFVDPGSFETGNADLWRDIGVSATAPLVEGAESNVQAIQEWSVRWQIAGGRSTLNSSFIREWRRKLAPLLQRNVRVESDLMGRVLNQPGFEDAQIASGARLRNQLASDVARAPGADWRSQVRMRCIEALERDVYRPVGQGRFKPDSSLEAELRPLMAEQAKATAGVQEAMGVTRELIQRRQKAAVLSLAYTDHRNGPGEDVAEGKLLGVLHHGGADLQLNAGASYFRDRAQVVDRSNLKEYAVAASVEWQRPNPFRENPNDQARLLGSLSLLICWPQELDDHITIGQLRFEFPMAGGVTLPLSATWASRTELINEAEVRGNLGFTIDTDKLFALARVAANAGASR